MTALVADASPLIALHQIGQLSLVESLFGTAIVPPAVTREIAPSVPRVSWIIEHHLTQPIATQVLEASLGEGESEAISLALEIGADRVLVDERAARRLAQAVGLSIIGTLGVLLAAKRKGLLPAIRSHVESLLERGFWIAPRIVEETLRAAGVGPTVR